MSSCPCGTGKSLNDCCGPYLEGEAAPTPEALMRSRYTAFATKNTDYLEETTDPQASQEFDFEANEEWARNAEFTGLEILSAKEEGNKGFVEFRARFRMNGEDHVHHEKSKFRKQGGVWFFRDGKVVKD